MTIKYPITKTDIKIKYMTSDERSWKYLEAAKSHQEKLDKKINTVSISSLHEEMKLSKLQSEISKLIKLYGPNSILELDAGCNNISFNIIKSNEN